MRKGRPVGSRRFWFESDHRFIQLFGRSTGLPVVLGRGNDGEAANSVTWDVYYSHQQPIEVVIISCMEGPKRKGACREVVLIVNVLPKAFRSGGVGANRMPALVRGCEI